MPRKPPQGFRLRIGRHSEPGRIYLLTFVTRERMPVFHSWQLGRQVVHVLQRETESANTLCYVVMPDHVHWLMQLTGRKALSSVVRTVKAASAMRINLIRGSREPLWQKGFHDHALRGEEDIRALARYVVANPLRAGLVERIGDYPLWDAVWI